MRTILIAAVIAILAGIVYQKVVEENVSVKEIASYVAGTAKDMAKEASKAVNEQDLKGVEESINTIAENAGSILQEKRDKFIKEQLPEMMNIDMQEVWQNVTCDKALAMYDDYISGDMAAQDSEETVYTMFSLLKQKGENDKALKDTVINLFCDNKN